MKKVLSLGKHYVSDFVKLGEEPRGGKYSLDLFLDEEIGAVRLNDPVPLDKMYGQYWYRSGINSSMTKQLGEIVEEVLSRKKLSTGDIWVDIACNDGTMFKFIPSNITKIGIDPADDSYVAESSKHADEIVQDYFSADAYKKTAFGSKKAKVITCIAMFYDLDDPRKFIKDIYEILDDDGIFVVQMSYTPLMIKQMAFDNICHEHVYYYDLTSIKNLFESGGFVVRDCSLNETNGGSFRVYLQKQCSKVETFGTAPLRDVCDARIQSILLYEDIVCNIRDPHVWEIFATELDNLKVSVKEFLENAQKEGKTVYGYGASTKGNTLLQLFEIDQNLITAIAERSPYKFGLKTVGTNIPIVSEEVMRGVNPDYLFVLPWHFIDEFASREGDFLSKGGKLVVPCPLFNVIGSQ